MCYCEHFRDEFHNEELHKSTPFLYPSLFCLLYIGGVQSWVYRCRTVWGHGETDGRWNDWSTVRWQRHHNNQRSGCGQVWVNRANQQRQFDVHPARLRRCRHRRRGREWMHYWIAYSRSEYSKLSERSTKKRINYDFNSQRYAIAVYAVIICPSVRLSVCPSVWLRVLQRLLNLGSHKQRNTIA